MPKIGIMLPLIRILSNIVFPGHYRIHKSPCNPPNNTNRELDWSPLYVYVSLQVKRVVSGCNPERLLPIQYASQAQ